MHGAHRAAVVMGCRWVVITGRSGHLLIIMTLLKISAESPRMMDKLWDWYASTLYTRLEPEVGAIVVIQTRWSENDCDWSIDRE